MVLQGKFWKRLQSVNIFYISVTSFIKMVAWCLLGKMSHTKYFTYFINGISIISHRGQTKITKTYIHTFATTHVDTLFKKLFHDYMCTYGTIIQKSQSIKPRKKRLTNVHLTSGFCTLTFHLLPLRLICLWVIPLQLQ